MLRLGVTDESGNVLITVVLVSMLIGALAAAALRTGESAETSAARDRNHQIALAVAESGVHDVIAQINEDPQAYMGCTGTEPEGDICAPSDTTPDGEFWLVAVERIDDGFVINSRAATGGEILGRDRRIRVTLLPPPLFDERYALFSFTSIDVKNDDEITGDVWANDSVHVRQRTRIIGSVTAATSWIQLENGARVDDFVWSGGFNPTGDAIRIGNAPSEAPSVGGFAKASVSDPSEVCDGTQSNYRVVNNGKVVGGITSCGSIGGSGSADGTVSPNIHTLAPPVKPLPTFTFDPANYDSVQEFDSVGAFQDWLDDGNQSNLHGTFKIDEPSPSQSCDLDLPPETCHRIDLSGVSIGDDLTIVTNAPVLTEGMSEGAVGTKRPLMFIVSHYEPPTDTACNVNEADDLSECAIHAKNNFSFSPDCKTAVLLYADKGPVAVKNNQGMCGSIVSDGILIKNNQTLEYDERVDRILGFGSVTYEIARWEECPVSGCAP